MVIQGIHRNCETPASRYSLNGSKTAYTLQYTILNSGRQGDDLKGIAY